MEKRHGESGRKSDRRSNQHDNLDGWNGVDRRKWDRRGGKTQHMDVSDPAALAKRQLMQDRQEKDRRITDRRKRGRDRKDLMSS